MDIPNKKYFSVNRRRGEAPVSQTPLENPENPLNPNGSGGGAEGQIPPVSQRYDSESEMIADQESQRLGFLYFDGTNTWWYLGTDNGDVSDYFLFANPTPQGDRVVNGGTFTFPTSTSLKAEDSKWIIGGIEHDTTPINLSPIEGTPTDYNRTDSIYGNPDGTIGYVSGYEDPEGSVDAPPIPVGTLLLATVLRTPAGDNTVYVTPAELTDFVSKSQEGYQTIQSDFAIAPQGLATQGLPNYTVFDGNGKLLAYRPDQSGVFRTLQGIGGYSRILTITIRVPDRFNYDAVIQVDGVSTLSEKGFLWVSFTVDATGDLVTNKLKTFGKFTLSKYTLVRTDTDKYELFLAHDDFNAYFKFRPDFGSSDFAYYHLQPKVDPLPSGDQYTFSKYSDSPLTDDELAGIQDSDSPAGANPFITVSALTSYAYVQEAPTGAGVYYARRNSVWTAFTPFVVAGTPTDGHVVTSVAGVPTWVAPSGGSSKWTEDTSGNIYRATSAVAVGEALPTGATHTFYIKRILTGDALRVVDSDGTLLFRLTSTTAFLDSPILRVGGASLVAGTSIKTSSTTGTGFDIKNSANTQLFFITNDGRYYLFGTNSFRTYINNPASQILGFHYKGGYSSNTPIVAFDNLADSRVFELRGDGKVIMPIIPTSDPLIIGALWNDSGTVKISAG